VGKAQIIVTTSIKIVFYIVLRESGVQQGAVLGKTNNLRNKICFNF
jgi:hypothetical protein